MEKYNGTRYNSLWDSSTWSIIALVMVCCVIPCFSGDGIWPTIICLFMLAFILVTFIGIYQAYKECAFRYGNIALSTIGYNFHRQEDSEKFYAAFNFAGASAGVYWAASFHKSWNSSWKRSIIWIFRQLFSLYCQKQGQLFWFVEFTFLS